MDIRDKLLEATARVYAETGYRGATTRRIAHEAGVNEITLFRHFGSKDALIREALMRANPEAELVTLPSAAVDPASELTDWSIAQFRQIHAARSMIRKSMSEMEEHPDFGAIGTRCPRHGGEDLLDYLDRLRAAGLASADTDTRAAARMLMGAIFSEALTRDLMPHQYTKSVDQAMSTYVTLILRAIGTAQPPRSSGSRGSKPKRRPRVKKAASRTSRR